MTPWICRPFSLRPRNWAQGDLPVTFRGPAYVCSRDATNAFDPNRPRRGTAVKRAGERPGNGHDGKPRKDTGKPRAAEKNGMPKAAATESGSKREQSRFPRRRG